MKRRWTVIEKVGQEYYYQVEAESKQEAIEKVRTGKAGVVAGHTKQKRPEYNAM